jgi:release factor glutamine methyltransferase
VSIHDFITDTTKQLTDAGIGTARLDCLVLLEDAVGKDRSWLLAHPEFVISDTVLRQLEGWVAQRAKHMPLAYVRGKTEFYGREFIVGPDVLEPRPESETMIELLKKLASEQDCTIVDVGTGSGALAITAKLELPATEVIGIDIDPNCLKIARQNAAKHATDVTFYQGDLLEPLYTLAPKPYTLLCNLPYVPDDHQINQAAMNEPRLAIFGGADGLDLYRRLFTDFHGLSRFPVLVFTESLPFQHTELAAIAQAAGYRQAGEDDFIQVFSHG